MPFTKSATIELLKTEWQYTEPIEGEYFRLRHTEAPNGGLYAIAQAVIEADSTIQLFDSQVLAFERGILDTLRLKKPGWTSERRLAFKKLPKQATLEEELRRLLLPGFLQAQPQDPFNFVRKSEWKIDIEVSDYIEANANAPQPAPQKELNYASNGDINGVFYYLGTNKLSQSFANPATSGRIKLFPSSVYQSYVVNNIVDRSNNFFVSSNSPNSYVSIDLVSTKLQINGYLLRGSTSFAGQSIRNWKLQASHDNSTWVDIDSQVNNQTITTDNWLYIPIQNQQESYQYFRIISTGANADPAYPHHLVIGELELYGKVPV